MEGNVFMINDIPWDTPICQYMRLDYFISLLAKKEYFVRPRCEFDDVFEVNLPMPKMFPIHEAAKIVSPAVLNDECQKMSEKLKANRENCNLLTSCWCLQTYENMLMWNCYASKIGVRITSTIRRFLISLNTDIYDVLCGCMSYTGYSFYNDDLYFTKDRGYQNEDEYRFYLIPKVYFPATDTNKPKPVRLKVEPSVLIKDAIVSPYIETRVANEICKLIKDRYGIVIRTSSLKTNG